MNILVVDVAASESGAMSILKMYYNELLNDTDNRYYFCVSTPLLESKKYYSSSLWMGEKIVVSSVMV